MGALEKPDMALILLLTCNVLLDERAMAEVHRAIKLKRLLIPVNVWGRGYNFGAAGDTLARLNTGTGSGR